MYRRFESGNFPSQIAPQVFQTKTDPKVEKKTNFNLHLEANIPKVGRKIFQ